MQRALRPLALAAAGSLSVSGASAAPAWDEARASAGYRLTAGSRDYVGHAFLGRAALPLTPRWSGYTRLDLVTDRAYDAAFSGVLGFERELPRRWLGWAGAGASEASLDGGGSASAFLFETGAGRPIGRWWSDAEYRLTSGKIGRALPGGAAEQAPASDRRSGASPASHDGGHGGGGQPVLSSPSEFGESFDQHEVSILVASPIFRLWRPVSFGISPSAWTRSGGLKGASGYGSLTIRASGRWSVVLGTSADFPNRGPNSYYGSAGVRCAILPR